MTAELSAPLVLASASPRRREILDTLGIPFRVQPSEVDETREPGEAALDFVRRAARMKAQDVAARLGEPPAPFVLGADTVVIVDGEALGKPADDREARKVIARLAGRWHEVATALAVARGGGEVLADACVLTRVRFRSLAAEEMDGYVASGEGRDKAGAYAVQGLGSGLVAAIEGSYHNVVGLPAVETLEVLREAGALGRWP